MLAYSLKIAAQLSGNFLWVHSVGLNSELITNKSAYIKAVTLCARPQWHLMYTLDFFPNQGILKFLIKVHLECNTESVVKSKLKFPSFGGLKFSVRILLSFLQLIIMGRGKKSLSHQLGKITTWKVVMSSQPDAEKGGNPSLCRRKGGHQLLMWMLQALERYALHWDISANFPHCSPPTHFCISFLRDLSATSPQFCFPFWILLYHSLLLRLDWLYWDILKISAINCSCFMQPKRKLI